MGFKKVKITHIPDNTYVDGIPTDNLTWELDRPADLVYAEVIEERNWEEVARYADSDPESD